MIIADWQRCFSLFFSQIIRSLFERAMNITHDMGLRSIAFPFIGTGVLKYPPLEVMKALLDASSLFREKDSPLKTVYIVVWEQDHKTEQVNILLDQQFSRVFKFTVYKDSATNVLFFHVELHLSFLYP